MNIFKSNSSVVVCNNFLLTDDKDATSVSKIYLFLNESINRIPSESANIQEININGQVIAEDSELANTFNNSSRQLLLTLGLTFPLPQLNLNLI